jgi:hypothetical protein
MNAPQKYGDRHRASLHISICAALNAAAGDTF